MTNETFLPHAAEGGAAPTTERTANPSPETVSADIAGLCHDLAEALANPEYGTVMLRRQAQLLDHLLYSVMERKAQADLDGGRAADAWIDLVLKIQRQCMDTVKSISAIDYMQAIAPRPAAQPLPQNPLPPPPETRGTNYKGGR